jgi:quercetin dioxygenase-like cupin family protein
VKERIMRIVNRVVAGLALASIVAMAIGVAAQAPAAQTGFKRTPVQQADLSVPGREVVQAVAEISAGSESGRHTHPGEEFGYVLEGTLTIEFDGKPSVTKKTGEGFSIPPGTIHNAKNLGKGVTKVLATYIIEKGKPAATPAK